METEPRYERPLSLEHMAIMRMKAMEDALRHAQEALFWHRGLDFEMDGRKVSDAIASALAPWETQP